jgi:hypothetical protein
MTKILEAVTPELKDIAERTLDMEPGSRLSDKAHEKVSNALGGGNHTIIDLGSGEKYPDIDVEEHLNKHGYEIHDYKAGSAVTTKKVGNPDKGIPYREKQIVENIGKVLHKTGAPDSVKNAFANDPARTASKSHGLKILISNHPYATVGKTSGTKWSGESCMNAESGGHRAKLKADNAHGTHEAFLVHPDDDCVTKGDAWPSNPIARVSLKRFDNKTGDTIFRAETRGYGADGSDFHNAVNDWANRAYPAQKGERYTKHHELYNDSDSAHEEPSIDTLKNLHNNNTESNYRLSHQDQKIAIGAALSDGKLATSQVSTLANNASNWSPRHIGMIIKNSESPTKSAYILSPEHGDKYSSSDIERFRSGAAQFGLRNYPSAILKNPRLSDEAIDALPTNNLTDVPTKRIKPHHVDKIVNAYLNEESGSAKPIANHNSLLSSDHIDKIIDHNIARGGVSNVLPHLKNITQKHADKIANNWGRFYYGTQNDIVKNFKFLHPKMVDDRTDALGILGNKNTTNDEVKHLAAKKVMETLGDKRFGIIPKGSSKYFSDNDVSELLRRGDHLSLRDADLSNRIVNKHLDVVDNELKSFGEKYDKVESPETHPDFEQDRDNANVAMYDHNHLMYKHADNFGSFKHLQEQTDAAEDVMNKHFRSGSTTSHMDKTKSPSVNKYLRQEIDYTDANQAAQNHENNRPRIDD